MKCARRCAAAPSNERWLEPLSHGRNDTWSFKVLLPPLLCQIPPQRLRHAGKLKFNMRLVTNLHEHDFNAQSQLFTQKLLDRGFPIDLIRKISARVTWAEKATILSQPSVKSRKRVVPFKITYCKGIQQLCISSSLHLFSDCLRHSLTEKYRLVACYQSVSGMSQTFWWDLTQQR